MGEYLTVSEVAERLKVAPLTVRRWLNSKQLTGISLGDRAGWRIDENDLEDFLKKRRSGPETETATAE